MSSKAIKGGIYSSPVKLNEYPPTKGPTQIKVEKGDGASKLPKK